jgi:hypothetical protein
VAETVIELDLSSPWEPPEPPRDPLRFRLRTRWTAALTVLAVASAVLAAAGPRPRTQPRYEVLEQVRSVIIAGDMLIVGRFQQATANPGIEGRRLSDGKVLWHVAADLQQQYMAVGTGALIMIRYSNADRGYTNTLTAIDLATGRQLWTRPQTSLIGTGAGLVVVEETPEPARVVEITEEQQQDLTVNDAGDPQPRHLLVLDERTGVPAWEMTVPPGTVLEFAWDGLFPAGRITGAYQLDPSGLVTSRDIRTGAVVATRQLDWTGTPAMFNTGAAWLMGPGQQDLTAGRAVIYPDGERGGIVFDLADGRSLFRTDVVIYDGLYQCAATLFCATTESGTAAYDSTTGASRWRLGGYAQVVATVGGRLVVTTFEEGDTARAGKVGVVDARTGAVVRDLGGWRLIFGTPAGRVLLWHPDGRRAALLGELDPVTGGITVFGRADEWYGAPECSAGADTLACVMVGDATVWRLPGRHPRR